MSDLKIDPDTGDLLIESGDLVMTKEADAIRQHISQRLKSFAGEWFLDLDAGLPYYRDILVKNPNTLVVSGLIQEEIIKTPGVIELRSFEFVHEKATRALTVKFEVLVDNDFVLSGSAELGG
jgi:hypothetical protein